MYNWLYTACIYSALPSALFSLPYGESQTNKTHICCIETSINELLQLMWQVVKEERVVSITSYTQPTETNTDIKHQQKKWGTRFQHVLRASEAQMSSSLAYECWNFIQ